MKMVLGLALLLLGGFILFEVISGNSTAIVNAFKNVKDASGTKQATNGNTTVKPTSPTIPSDKNNQSIQGNSGVA